MADAVQTQDVLNEELVALLAQYLPQALGGGQAGAGARTSTTTGQSVAGSAGAATTALAASNPIAAAALAALSVGSGLVMGRKARKRQDRQEREARREKVARDAMDRVAAEDAAGAAASMRMQQLAGGAAARGVAGGGAAVTGAGGVAQAVAAQVAAQMAESRARSAALLEERLNTIGARADAQVQVAGQVAGAGLNLALESLPGLLKKAPVDPGMALSPGVVAPSAGSPVQAPPRLMVPLPMEAERQRLLARNPYSPAYFTTGRGYFTTGRIR